MGERKLTSKSVSRLETRFVVRPLASESRRSSRTASATCGPAVESAPLDQSRPLLSLSPYPPPLARQLVHLNQHQTQSIHSEPIAQGAPEAGAQEQASEHAIGPSSGPNESGRSCCLLIEFQRPACANARSRPNWAASGVKWPLVVCTMIPISGQAADLLARVLSTLSGTTTATTNTAKLAAGPAGLPLSRPLLTSIAAGWLAVVGPCGRPLDWRRLYSRPSSCLFRGICASVSANKRARARETRAASESRKENNSNNNAGGN